MTLAEIILATNEKAYPLVINQKGLIDILATQNKRYLCLYNTKSDRDLLTFCDLAASLEIEVVKLRSYFCDKGPLQSSFLSPDDLRYRQCLKMSILRVISFGPETLSDDSINLSNQKVLRAKDNFVYDSGITAPFIEGGLSKFPLSEPTLQISSKGAFKYDSDTIFSIDGDGVISEINLSKEKRPRVKELGRMSLPNLQQYAITGFSGVKEGKVFFVSVIADSSSKLFALDGTLLEVLGSVSNVTGPISCDEVGNVFFVDESKTLRIVTSNLSSLKERKIIPRSSQREQTIQNAASALNSLVVPEIAELITSAPKTKEEEELDKVQKALLQKVKPGIDRCSSLKEISSMQHRIGELRARDEFLQLPEAFSMVDSYLGKRMEELAYPELEKQIGVIKNTLESNEADLPALRSHVKKLVEVRASVVLRDNDRRATIGAALEEISQQMQELNHRADVQAAQQFGAELQHLDKAMKSCTTQEEVFTLALEGKGTIVSELIRGVSDKKLQDELQKLLDQTVKDKVRSIAESVKAEESQRREELNRARKDHQRLSEMFAEHITVVADSSSLSKLMGSSVTKAVREQINQLPLAERQEAHTALDRMLAEQRKAIEVSHRVNELSKVDGFVRLGNVDFPLSGNAVDAQVKPPAVKSNWVINKHYEQYLGELGELLIHQRKLQQDLVIIEGDAGAAKSGLVQIFCALTNRPMYTFACNGQTEKENFTYLYQYDPKKGTYRVDSGFIEALQTKDMVVLLEEINALPVTVAKMLNTLFDYRRELYLPDRRVIKADPSVLIVGLQNPQSYAGVNKLSKEFLSRALIMEMGYAKANEGNRFLPYEAEMYSRYRPTLEGLKQEEFYALWDKVINNRPSDGASEVFTPEREREVKGLKRLIDVANSARAAYRAYQQEDSTEPFEFIFSYREAEVIASLWNGVSPIEEVIERVILPKIADPIEKKAMNALISSKSLGLNQDGKF